MFHQTMRPLLRLSGDRLPAMLGAAENIAEDSGNRSGLFGYALPGAAGDHLAERDGCK